MTNSILTRCTTLLALCLASLFLCADAFAQRQASSTTVPLFSWWSPEQEDNFATSDPRWGMPLTEARADTHHISNGPARGGYRLYRLEGMIFDPGRPQPSGTVPLYSWWNAARGDNFATTDPAWTGSFRGKQTTNEHLQNGPSRDGYTLYRLEGYLFDPNKPQPAGTVPVYSWWNADRGDNFLTTSSDWDKGFGQRASPQVQGQRSKGGYTLYRLEGFIKKAQTLPGAQDTPNRLEAKICEYGDPTCNRCVANLPAQLADEAFLNKSSAKDKFRFPLDITWGSFRPGNSPHVQGVGRLPDWNGRGRMVIAENATREGIHLAFQDIEGATEAAHSTSKALKDRQYFDIKGSVPLGNYKHPGGLQTQGDIVAIAMEDHPNKGPAAVYFLTISGEDIRYSGVLLMDGSRGEPGQNAALERPKGAAATSGFVRLHDGHYLVAVSGRKHGTEGIWFYRSDRPQITMQTGWDYLGMYRSSCIGYDADISRNCYAGAGGGLSLVADCSGDIYMLGMTATTKKDDFDGMSRNNEYLQVFKITSNRAPAEIKTTLVHQLTAPHGAPTTGRKSFRWAGGSYVDKSGKLLIMNTRRTTSDRMTGGISRPRHGTHVEGDVYFSND